MKLELHAFSPSVIKYNTECVSSLWIMYMSQSISGGHGSPDSHIELPLDYSVIKPGARYLYVTQFLKFTTYIQYLLRNKF